MKYDLEKIKEELDTLPSYDTQLYLQGDTKDMDSHEAIRNYLLVDETENDFNIPFQPLASTPKGIDCKIPELSNSP